MSEPVDPTVGRELIGFFERFRKEGFPSDWKAGNTLEERFGLSTEAANLLREGDTATIEKHVKFGQQTPMIFWPPGPG